MPSLDLTDALVIAGAIAAIIWVLWYFFFAEQQATHAQDAHVDDRASRRAQS